MFFWNSLSDSPLLLLSHFSRVWLCATPETAAHQDPPTLGFSRPGFSNMWTVNILMFNLVLEKAEEPEIKLPTSAGSWKKLSSRKTSISALLTIPKPLTVWITLNCGKFWKRWEYLTTWPASWETYMQVRKQQLELFMEQQTGWNRKRSTSGLYIVILLI